MKKSTKSPTCPTKYHPVKRYPAKRYKSDSPKWKEEWLDYMRSDCDADPYSVLRFLSYKIRRTGDYIARHDIIEGSERVKRETDEVAELLWNDLPPFLVCSSVHKEKADEWLRILSEDADYDFACILEMLIERLRRFRESHESPPAVVEDIKRTEGLLRSVMEDRYFHELCKKHKPPHPKWTKDEKGRRVINHTDEQCAIIRPLVKAAEEAQIEDLRLALKSLCDIFYWSGIKSDPKVQKRLERACKLMVPNLLGWWD